MRGWFRATPSSLPPPYAPGTHYTTHNTPLSQRISIPTREYDIYVEGLFGCTKTYRGTISGWGEGRGSGRSWRCPGGPWSVDLAHSNITTRYPDTQARPQDNHIDPSSSCRSSDECVSLQLNLKCMFVKNVWCSLTDVCERELRGEGMNG